MERHLLENLAQQRILKKKSEGIQSKILKNLKMKNLQLSLKKEWFEMTKAGIKTEDYREITPYWAKRLVGSWSYEGERKGLFPDLDKSFMNSFKIRLFKSFSQNTMTLGYPKSTYTERILKYEHKGIEIRTGNPEWGAEPGKLYFVIMHGNKINQ